MQSRIPRCQASCARKEDDPPQHDSTVSNVQDAFSSLMDSGDSPCSVQQSIALSSSAESVEKRPVATGAPARSERANRVKWAVNEFYDESLTPLGQGKVTTRSTDYTAPTPQGTFNFKTSHEFTPPASLVYRKPAKQRTGRLRPATESEKAEELAYLVYAAPPRPPRPPVAVPAATLNSTPPEPCATSPASLAGQSCLESQRTPARQEEGILQSLLQERSHIAINERNDASEATPSVLKNLLCTATSANFTSATDAAYQRLICPTVGASSVLKQSIDSWSAGEGPATADGELPQLTATNREVQNPEMFPDYCASKGSDSTTETSCPQQLDAESDRPSLLPKRAVTPKPVPVLASTPEDVPGSKGVENSPHIVQAESWDSRSPSESNASVHVGYNMDTQPKGSTPGSWLLQLGAQTVVHESIESTVLPELSAEQWQAHVPGDTPTSRSCAAIVTARVPAASGQEVKSSKAVGGIMQTPRLGSTALNGNKVIQVQSGGLPQGEVVLHTPRQGTSAPPKLAKSVIPANPVCAVAAEVLQPPQQTPVEAGDAQAPDQKEPVAREPFVLDSHTAGDSLTIAATSGSHSRSERESAEYPLLRRSITDIVTHIGGNLDELQPCLRNTISDATPIDLNPQISCVAAQMPIFNSPVPQGQQVSVQTNVGERKPEAKQHETSIPVHASALCIAPDSPCSRSLKKCAEDGATCLIPKPALSNAHSKGSSPRHPPAPRLPLVRSKLSPCSPRPAHAPPPFSPDVVTFKRTRSMSSSPYTPKSSAPCNKKATQGRSVVSPVLSPGALSRPNVSSHPASFGSSEVKSPIARLRSLVPSSPSPQASPRVPSRQILPLSVALSQSSPETKKQVSPAIKDPVQKDSSDGELISCAVQDDSPDSHKENCGVLPISAVIDSASTKPAAPILDHSPLIQGSNTTRGVFIPALKLHQAVDLFGDNDEDAIVPDTERGVRWSLRTPPKCEVTPKEPSMQASPLVLPMQLVGTPGTHRRGTASRSIHASPSPLGPEVKPSPKPIHVVSPLHADSAAKNAQMHHSTIDAAVQDGTQGVPHRLSVRTPFVEALKRMHEPHLSSPPRAPATPQIHRVPAVSTAPVDEATAALVTHTEDLCKGEAQSGVEPPAIAPEDIHPEPLVEIAPLAQGQYHVLHEDDVEAGMGDELGQGDIGNLLEEQRLGESGANATVHTNSEAVASSHFTIEELQHRAGIEPGQSAPLSLLPDHTQDSSSSVEMIDVSIEFTASSGSEPHLVVSSVMDTDSFNQVHTGSPQNEGEAGSAEGANMDRTGAAQDSEVCDETNAHSPAAPLMAGHSDSDIQSDILHGVALGPDKAAVTDCVLAISEPDEPLEMGSPSGMEPEYGHQNSVSPGDELVLQRPPLVVHSSAVDTLHTPDSQSSDLSTSVGKVESRDDGSASMDIQEQNMPLFIPQHPVAVPIDSDRDSADNGHTSETTDEATDLVAVGDDSYWRDSKSLSSKAVVELIKAAPGTARYHAADQDVGDVGTCPCKEDAAKALPATLPIEVRESELIRAAKKAIDQQLNPSIWMSCLRVLQTVATIGTALGFVFLMDVRQHLPTEWFELAKAHVSAQIQRASSFIKTSREPTYAAAQAASSVTPEIVPQSLHAKDDAHASGLDAQPGPLTRRRAQSTAYSVASDRDLSTIRPERYSVFEGRSIIPDREIRAARRRV